MKLFVYLTICLLNLPLLCVSEESLLFKKYSVDFRNLPLGEVLSQLEKKAGVKVTIAPELLQNQDSVNLVANDQEVGRIIARILRPRGLKIEKIDDNSLAISKYKRQEEFNIKREEIFEFLEKPKLVLEGDKITINFETKAFCDVTVAIEDSSSKIIRHLASGVLGENAPEPFLWNSKKQSILWDSKDDKGEYVKDKADISIRVSLGLKPAFEKPLFWSPHKRFGSYAPIICSTPEGVYVSEGYTVDSVKLFDHSGSYNRTIYPFPANKIDQILGIEVIETVQTKQKNPKKLGSIQATLLTSGNSCVTANHMKFGGGIAATTMAVQGDRIALSYLNLNRLKTDGSTGGLPLKGPETGFIIPKGTMIYQENPFEMGPTSSAFSPDGKTLYVTGYVYFNWNGYSRQGVYKINYEKNSPPEVFAGNMEANGFGDDNAHFAIPNSVVCDAKGRVYVADYLNNRIQIYDPDGKFLKTIPVTLPAKVQIDPKTQEIYVFSWYIVTGISNELVVRYKLKDGDNLAIAKNPPVMTRFGTFDDPKLISKVDLPINLIGTGQQQSWMGQLLHVEMDFYSKQPTLWMVGRKYQVNQAQIAHSGPGVKGGASEDVTNSGICLAVFEDNQFKKIESFGELAQKAISRLKPPDFGIQLLSVNEKTHKLYVLETVGFNKSSSNILEIDPESGSVKPIAMPFDAEDICFDQDGVIYLRTDLEVVRYDLNTWREIPWDYGEERKKVSFASGPAADVMSALPLPGVRPGLWHQGGMWVSPKGHLAVACSNAVATVQGFKGAIPGAKDKPFRKYTPTVYAGRQCMQEVHIWDKYGKPIMQDAIPGLGYFNGIGIDKDDSLYVMFQAPRNIDEKSFMNVWQGTMIKFEARDEKRDSIKVLSTGGDVPFPLKENEIPKRSSDTLMGGWYGSWHGKTWMSGAEWFYGGAGVVGNGCSCYHSRFQMDRFARSFAPEPDVYSVAVLDSNGNLILRVGKYGNIDDGKPLASQYATPTSRSIGGDEVSLFYPAYIGVDTDRRLFISDIGNARIVSVKLNYQTEGKIELKTISNQSLK
jgi:hypothetical protein